MTKKMTNLQQVQKNGLKLKDIEDQSEDLCLAAVRQNGLALEFVKKQTQSVCLAAVKSNGMSLEHVKEQTNKICLAAVKKDGFALLCVRDQTLDICIAALENTGTDSGQSNLHSYVKIFSNSNEQETLSNLYKKKDIISKMNNTFNSPQKKTI